MILGRHIHKGCLKRQHLEGARTIHSGSPGCQCVYTTHGGQSIGKALARVHNELSQLQIGRTGWAAYKIAVCGLKCRQASALQQAERAGRARRGCGGHFAFQSAQHRFLHRPDLHRPICSVQRTVRRRFCISNGTGLGLVYIACTSSCFGRRNPSSSSQLTAGQIGGAVRLEVAGFEIDPQSIDGLPFSSDLNAESERPLRIHLRGSPALQTVQTLPNQVQSLSATVWDEL